MNFLKKVTKDEEWREWWHFPGRHHFLWPTMSLFSHAAGLCVPQNWIIIVHTSVGLKFPKVIKRPDFINYVSPFWKIWDMMFGQLVQHHDDHDFLDSRLWNIAIMIMIKTLSVHQTIWSSYSWGGYGWQVPHHHHDHNHNHDHDHNYLLRQMGLI